MLSVRKVCGGKKNSDKCNKMLSSCRKLGNIFTSVNTELALGTATLNTLFFVKEVAFFK